MIHRFKKVTNELYRGSAPSPQDVANLKKFGIKKIVSLDKESGDKIDRICKAVGIIHVMVPIDYTRKSLLDFLSHDFNKLFLTGGPTFIHCLHGKDRTGLACALIECKFLGKDSEKAIQEAESLGFGVGLPPHVINTYKKLIRNCKPIKDVNQADIVSNEREYKSDNRDSFLDEGHQGSFAPYLSQTRQNPMDAVYNYIDDQSPTRENYHPNKPIKEHPSEDAIPQVGTFDNDAGARGFGPTENYGGFFYD
jgi:hypothetical protein